jgi:threonine dehydrogenase-like Zn-dependent dehydrogenase
MRALVLNTNGASVATDRPVPIPLERDVLVRVVRAGICETDLQLIAGYMAFRGVLGHEFVGVAESGPFAGRRVVGEINCSCWTCETCRSGMPTHCPGRTTLGISGRDGAFADFVAVPQRNLHVVPDSISTDAAVFTEPLAAAFQVPAQIAVRPGDRVIVLGDGRLGNLCAQVLANFTSRLLVVGKHPEKLALLQSLGLATCLLHDAPTVDRADTVVDCTGSETGLATALKLVRPRGTVVLKTTVADRDDPVGKTLSLSPVVVNEVTIVGSRCGPFDRALAALESGDVQVLPLISERFDLSRGVEALQRAAAPGVLKILLDV